MTSRKHNAQAEPVGMSGEPVAYYVYEWDTEFGVHRDTSPNPWNGMPPTRSVPIYAKPDPRIAELEALLREAHEEIRKSKESFERIEAALNASQTKRK